MKIIELGSKVKDSITEFEGIVTSRAVHMNGCDRYWVQPTVDKDGKNRDGMWIDVTTLKVLKEPKQRVPQTKPGGFSSTIK